MRLPLVSALLLASLSDAKLRRFNEHRELTPNDVGAYHTDAFEKLGDRYKLNHPKRKIDAMMDVSNIMSSYCADNDAECKSYAHRSTVEQFYSVQHGLQKVSFPDDFDPIVKNYMETILSITGKLTVYNVNDIIDELTQLQTQIEGEKSLGNDMERNLLGAAASVSVAIESTKLWHQVVTDPNHNLHEIVMSGRRKRRTQLNLVAIVNADILAVILRFVKEFLTGDINIFSSDKPDLAQTLAKAILDAISASAAAGLAFTDFDN